MRHAFEEIWTSAKQFCINISSLLKTHFKFMLHMERCKKKKKNTQNQYKHLDLTFCIIWIFIQHIGSCSPVLANEDSIKLKLLLPTACLGKLLKTCQWSQFSHHKFRFFFSSYLFIQQIIKNKSMSIYVLLKPSCLHFTLNFKMIQLEKNKNKVTVLVWNEMNQKHLSIHSTLIDQCSFVRMFFVFCFY